MPVTLTPVLTWPSDFTSVDTGDAANGINEPAHMQKLVNAAAWLKYRSERATYARYSLSAAGALTAGDKATLTQLFASSGYSISDNEITVPFAATYLIILNATITSSSTDDPTYSGLTVRRGASTSPEHNATGRGQRFNATAGSPFQTNAQGLIQITDTAQVFSAIANGSDIASIVTGSISIIGIPA